jgi:hypothetical protein
MIEMELNSERHLNFKDCLTGRRLEDPPLQAQPSDAPFILLAEETRLV